MFKKILLASSMLFIASTANAADGLIIVKSNHNVAMTTKKLVSILTDKKITVFSIIKHHEGAMKVDQKLRPTNVVIFGNPKIGTPLMTCAQSIAIDLPQKALISEDENGDVWLSYNDPAYLVKRHNVAGCEKIIAKVSGALAKFAAAATDK